MANKEYLEFHINRLTQELKEEKDGNRYAKLWEERIVAKEDLLTLTKAK